MIEKNDGNGYELVASVGLDETTKQDIQKSASEVVNKLMVPLVSDLIISIPLQRDEYLTRKVQRRE